MRRCSDALMVMGMKMSLHCCTFRNSREIFVVMQRLLLASRPDKVMGDASSRPSQHPCFMLQTSFPGSSMPCASDLCIRRAHSSSQGKYWNVNHAATINPAVCITPDSLLKYKEQRLSSRVDHIRTMSIFSHTVHHIALQYKPTCPKHIYISTVKKKKT